MTARNPLVFRQLFDRDTCTYSYLLADEATKAAILIDPVDTLVDRDLGLIAELGLTLTHVLNTHIHADHVTGSGLIKGRLPGVKSVLGGGARPASCDVYLAESDELKFGTRHVTATLTPGHTSGCTSFVLDDQSMVFTGDTLFVRGCGRTDFQQGDSRALYSSVHTKLFPLPDACKVYPAHDYKGRTVSTIGEEKQFNPRLTKTEDDFVALMAALNLSHPGKIDVAVPANMVCGYLAAEPGDVVLPAGVAARLRIPGTVVLDVRAKAEHEAVPTPDGALGATFLQAEADDAKAASELHDLLGADSKATVIITCCQAGMRAGNACRRLIGMGYSNTVNGGAAAAVQDAVVAAARYVAAATEDGPSPKKARSDEPESNASA